MREAPAPPPRATLGRPREFDEQAVLARIMEVFWVHGFAATSMSHLVDATGIKKGSLYAAFGDKRQMYVKALALYDREWIARLVATLAGRGGAWQRIDRFLTTAVEDAAGCQPIKGCFLCNAAVDHALVDHEARAMVTASLGRLEKALAAVVAQLPVPAPEAAARHLMSVYFGLRVLAKAGVPQATLDDARHRALQTVPAG